MSETRVEFVGWCCHGPWPIDANTADEAVEIGLRTAGDNDCVLTRVEGIQTTTKTITCWLPAPTPTDQTKERDQ